MSNKRIEATISAHEASLEIRLDLAGLVEVKTADLTHAALDWAVAKAVSRHAIVSPKPGGIEDVRISVQKEDPLLWDEWSPSTNWDQCGPLIDKDGISLIPPCPAHNDWDAYICDDIGNTIGAAERCETALIAVCRAVVSANLGDNVQVPTELIK